MKEQIIVKNELVDNKTKIISKEEEIQATTITIDEKTSMDNDQVVDQSKILTVEEDGEYEQTIINMDEQINMNNDQVVNLSTIMIKEKNEANLNKEEDGEELTIRMDEKTFIATQTCLIEDDQEDNKDDDQDNEEGKIHQIKMICKDCWCSCLCYCSIFCLAIPTVFMIVGSIYIYYGSSLGMADYYCAAQPHIPVLLVVCGSLVLLQMISLPLQFHIYDDLGPCVSLLLNIISPIVLAIFTFLILQVIPPTHDDSSQESYCPPFLYWYSFVSCLAGLVIYSCIVWCMWMAHQCVGH